MPRFSACSANDAILHLPKRPLWDWRCRSRLNASSSFRAREDTAADDAAADGDDDDEDVIVCVTADSEVLNLFLLFRALTLLCLAVLGRLRRPGRRSFSSVANIALSEGPPQSVNPGGTTSGGGEESRGGRRNMRTGDRPDPDGIAGEPAGAASDQVRSKTK